MPSISLSAITDDGRCLPVFSDHEHHFPDTSFSEGMSLDKSLQRSCVAWTGFVPDGTEASRIALLDNARFNSYFVRYERVYQFMHGVPDPITAENWDALSALISNHHAKDPDLHWKALIQGGCERLIQDAYWNPGDDMDHPQAFVPTFRIDKFMYGFQPKQVAPDDRYSCAHYGRAICGQGVTEQCGDAPILGSAIAQGKECSE